MPDRFSWTTARKIAWREARASSTRFLFVVVAVALGVGALTGVRGFSRAFREMLLKDARRLLAGDLSVRTFSLPSPEQEAEMESLVKSGVVRTWITESVSMLSPSPGATPVLVSLKAVDPAVYPFYGEVRLSPPVPLKEALKPDAVAVSEDLLLRLNLKVGDQVQLGAASFHIVGQVAIEPDRMAGSANVGPRILMSRQGIERTQLIVPGSRAAQRFLFKFNPGSIPVEKARERLKAVFPEALITDYRETHPLITRGLDRSTIFLSLVSLIALIVGAIGVGMAMHSHLQQKMDTIAVMKCLGARSSQIVRIYLLQTLMLGGLGGAAGIAVGLIVQRIFPILLARYFHLSPDMRLDLLSALQGLTIGVLTTLLFTLPPLVSIRRIRPALILRRDMEESRPSWQDRLKQGKLAGALAGVILSGILAIVYWLSDSLRVSAYFVGGFTASILALSLIAWLLLRLLKRISAWTAGRIPAAVRHGIANLYRPGNQATALLVALSLGVMFTLTVYLVQTSMLSQIASSAPPGMPNVFLINITPKEREGVAQMLKARDGIEGNTEVIPIVSARITKINGAAADQLNLRGFARRLLQTRNVTWLAEKPGPITVLEGRWWDPSAHAAKQGVQLCVSEDVAKALQLTPGALVEWKASSRLFASQVSCVYRNEAVRLGSNFDFVFIPGALDGLPILHFAAVRARPNVIAALQREMFARYPTVTVINGADVLAIIQEVVDQISLIIRFISLFAILAGAVILASSVAGTRFRRIREVVILKTLGATRARIAGIFSVEFLVLGVAAGLLGSILATAFSYLVLKRLFHVDYRFVLAPHLISIALTALLANAAGWMASHRILRQKPLEILRENL
ncbi:MAG: FtsX-like permease family protein [Bryobacteraceae bacterium]|nr:FtsX-like permease family protein [Bryobacteraceae bacterium]MDW8380103.1 FtsX-like permease family protein [Bryobacterales bacterium]